MIKAMPVGIIIILNLETISKNPVCSFHMDIKYSSKYYKMKKRYLGSAKD